MDVAVKLQLASTLLLKPNSGTCFRLTTWKPSHFPTQLEIHSINTSWRTFLINGVPAGVCIKAPGANWQIDIYSTPEWTLSHTQALRQRLLVAYGLTEKLNKFIAMAKQHPVLSAVPASFQGMYSSCPENIFELGLLAILLQNTTVNRSRDMLAAMLRMCGTLVEFDGVSLYCFFHPRELAALGCERLRNEARVGYRDKVLISFAEFFSGRDDLTDFFSQSSDATIAELLKIKGVGPYTAGVIASSVFRNPRQYGLDVWNRKILSQLLTGSDELSNDSLRDLIREEFAPYEGLAVEMLVESVHLVRPVCPIYATDDDARQASIKWPRPEHLQSIEIFS